MDSKQLLGARIKKVRMMKGLSQTDLAVALSTNKTYLSTIEKGRQNATFSTYERIANGLGLTIFELFAGVESKGSDT